MHQVIEECLTQKGVQRWARRPAHQVTVGILHPSGRMIWTGERASEEASEGSDRPKRIYEIGSITKTMTGLLLAAGEIEGVWRRSDRLSDLLPDLSSSPFANQKTLLHLVTHTAGLPDVPGNFKAAITDRLNPYANYDETRLIEAVLAEKPAEHSRHRYSNYGFGLLGWLLSKRLGMKLHEALNRYVFHPLGMPDTAAGSGPNTQGQLLPVYSSGGNRGSIGTSRMPWGAPGRCARR